MPLSDIVNVNITRQTQSVSEPGFGTLLILGANKNWNDLFKQYSNMQQVAMDFNPWDLDYIAAQDVFAQPISPPFILIGRRTVDTVDVLVETALPAQTYTVTINNIDATVNSTTSVQDSVLTLSANATWTITFSGDFTSDLTGVVVEVNGAFSTSVPWTTNQADTLTAIAAAIDVLGFTTSTPGSDSIVVVFNSASTSSVVNSVTIAGTSQPTLSSLIQTSGPLVTSNVATFYINTVYQTPVTFLTSSIDTMNVIASNIQTYLNEGYSPGVATVTVGGPNNNTLTVVSNPNQRGLITSFVVTLGGSQATASIVNTNQPTTNFTIADALVTRINNLSLGVTATTPGSPPTSGSANGIVTITANSTGVPYTIEVNTSIKQPNACRVLITQAIPNQSYTCYINGYNFTYQAPYNVSTNEQISLALVTSIGSPILLDANLNPIIQNGQTIANPIYNIISPTDNTNGSLELNSDSQFNILVSPFEAMTVLFGLIIGPYVPSASVVSDLQAIQDLNDDWYALACTDRTVATVEALAAYIETQIKIFGTASADLNIINQAPGTDTTSIAYVFQNAGYIRSFVMYHQDAAEDYPECAWFGVCLPLTPGSETWMFKQLASIPYSDLDSNQENNAFSKNANTYEFVGGIGITQKGSVSSGEFIDIIRGVDWLTSTIQSYVFNTLVINTKVPYTNSGIACIEAQIRRALSLGQNNNFISEEPPIQVIVPLAQNVSSTDKANRVLNGVSFQATLAGAIQAVTINGTVSV